MNNQETAIALSIGLVAKLIGREQEEVFSVLDSCQLLNEIDAEQVARLLEIEVIEEGTTNIMIKLPDFATTGKHFRCSCGGNVFRKRSDGKYRCNSCSELYTSNEEEASANTNDEDN